MFSVITGKQSAANLVPPVWITSSQIGPVSASLAGINNLMRLQYQERPLGKINNAWTANIIGTKIFSLITLFSPETIVHLIS